MQQPTWQSGPPWGGRHFYETRFGSVTAPVLRASRLVSAYRRYLITTDAPRFAGEVGRYYSSSTLQRLLGNGGIEMRRAAALALGMLGDAESIECLGHRLNDSDRGVRLAADDSFRGLLVRNAAPAHQQRLLQVMHLNDGGEFAAALAPALILVDQASSYAEAHHQLAVCWMGLGDLIAAEHAYRSCLWYCRFHYPSWVGLAHCRLRIEDPTNHDLRLGLSALRRALSICPDLEAARSEARRLERALENGMLGDGNFFGTAKPGQESGFSSDGEGWEIEPESADPFWSQYEEPSLDNEMEDDDEG